MLIPFTEFAHSPTFTASRTEITGRQQGIINWADLDLLYAYMFPPSILGNAQLPRRMDGSPVLFADRITYQPFPNRDAVILGTSPNRFQYAEVTIDYKSIAYEVSQNGRNIISRRIDMSGEFMTLPKAFLTWDSGAKVKSDEVSAGKIIGNQTYAITFHRVPNPPPFALLRSLRGKVNSNAFEGCAAQTLLFLGASFSQTVAYQGDDSWQVEMHFQERDVDGDTAIGWNHFFNPETGLWEKLKKADGSFVYAMADFNTLY